MSNRQNESDIQIITTLSKAQKINMYNALKKKCERNLEAKEKG